MEKPENNGLVFKRARISYINNYILAIILLTVLVLVYPLLNFKNILHVIVLFAVILLVVDFLQEPEWARIVQDYILTDMEIIRIEGLIKKQKTCIPYPNVADVKVIKGILGRLFNFGDVEIAGMKEIIKIKGVKNPEELYKIIQSRISKSFHMSGRKEDKEDKNLDIKSTT